MSEKKRRTMRGDVQRKRRRKTRQRRRQVPEEQGASPKQSVVLARGQSDRPLVIDPYDYEQYEKIARLCDSSDPAPGGDDPYFD